MTVLSRGVAFAAVVALAAGVALASHSSPSWLPRRALLQAGAPGAIPDACINVGLALQQQCQGEIDKATKFFGIEANPSDPSALSAAAANVSDADVDKYLADPNNKPATQCCKAACDFNKNYCSCDDNVLELVKSFTGGSVNLYLKIGQAFSTSCGFAPYLGSTCPAADQRGTPANVQC